MAAMASGAAITPDPGAGERTIALRQSAPAGLAPVRMFASWFCPYVQRSWIALEEHGADYSWAEIEPCAASLTHDARKVPPAASPPAHAGKPDRVDVAGCVRRPPAGRRRRDQEPEESGAEGPPVPRVRRGLPEWPGELPTPPPCPLAVRPLEFEFELLASPSDPRARCCALLQVPALDDGRGGGRVHDSMACVARVDALCRGSAAAGPALFPAEPAAAAAVAAAVDHADSELIPWFYRLLMAPSAEGRSEAAAGLAAGLAGWAELAASWRAAVSRRDSRAPRHRGTARVLLRLKDALNARSFAFTGSRGGCGALLSGGAVLGR